MSHSKLFKIHVIFLYVNRLSFLRFIKNLFSRRERGAILIAPPTGV